MSVKLTAEQKELLTALALGALLKAHRDLDGGKIYRLHPMQGAVTVLAPHIVDPLKRHQLIDSNKKFPAASYILTDKGRQVIEQTAHVQVNSLTSRRFDA